MSASFMEMGSTDSTEAAASKVAQHIESLTETSDVFDRLTQSGTLPISGLGEKYYIKGAPEFVISRRLPIPGELQLQMGNIHSQFSMGFFTEISRVWVVIDNNLYMWNYETNDDLAFFDSSDASILKVALVTIKKDVFEDAIKYGLVVGTVSDISLYPVVEVDEHGRSAIAIDQNRSFRIALDGAVVNDIAFTNNGRVFYTADDLLYEFFYEKQVGWFSTTHTCKGINQSKSIFGSLIPIPFFGNSTEELDQITIDKSRNIMYLLGKLGSISVYDLGENGDTLSKKFVVPAGKIAHEAHLLTQYGYDQSSFTNITSIRAIEAHESMQLNLVATTVKGVRLYLSTSNRINNTPTQNGHVYMHNSRSFHQSEVRPNCLRVAHVRFAPGVTPTSLYGEGPTGVSVVFSNEYLCAMATANRNIVYIFSNYQYPAAQQFVETATECDVPGHVWEIQTICKTKVVAKSPEHGIVEKVKPHAFYRSQLEEKTRMIVCSNEGVFEFTHQNGVDALREALYDGGVEGKNTIQLWQKLGSTEVLILAFQILTSDLPIDVRIKNKAEQILYTMKEAPEIVDSDRMMNDQTAWSPNESSIAEWRHRMKTPLLSSTPRGPNTEQSQHHQSFYHASPFSPMLNLSMANGANNMKLSPSRRHDALFYYFSRLVTPVWNDSICEVVEEKRLRITFDPVAIGVLKDEIVKLGKLMDDYRLVPSMEFGGYSHGGSDRMNAEANSLERMSLVGLRKLVDATVETLALWTLAFEYNIGAISSGMNPSILPNFASRRLSNLVADHSSLNSELIRAMIKYFLGDEAGTKQLSDSLRALCPTLYSEDDACVTFAMEQLEMARKMGPGAARRKLVATALEMYKQSIGKVALATTCQQLADGVEAHEAVVELCLLRALKEDPKQLAVLAFKHGADGCDNEMRVVEKKRSECYKVITDQLDHLEESVNSEGHRDAAVNRDLMINAVMTSDDQLAHCAVFAWLLSKNKTNVILQTKSPYIESFLMHEIAGGRGQKYFDLLWRFYEKSGCYDKAAILLSKLAANDDYKMGLAQRCAYLSHAILCAQSCNQHVRVPEMPNIDELRDRLDVANIQMRIRETLDLPGADQEMLRKLDGPILSLQELLLEYVAPKRLHKIKLALFHCANMYAEQHIFETWENILQDDFSSSNDESTLRESLLTTVADLWAVYKETKYFPRDFVIRRILEIGSGGYMDGQRVMLTPTFYPILCKRLEMTPSQFLKIAAEEMRSGGDAWWSNNEAGQEYITRVVLQMTKTVVRELEGAPTMARKMTAREVQTHILPFIRRACDVLANNDLKTLGNELSAIQNRLSELSA